MNAALFKQPVRFSNLKRMAESPAHYRAGLETSVDTASLRRGRITHSVLLGGPRVVLYEGRRVGAKWDAFKEAHSDSEIASVAEYRAAEGMGNAIARHPDAPRLLTGVREQTIFWTLGGRACRSTPDVQRPQEVNELKTCKSAHPERFVRDAMRYHYAAQLSFYRKAVASQGADVREAHIVAVESKPPHVVTVFRLTDAALEMGERTWRLWWERLMACEQSDSWPGYSQSIIDFDVPHELDWEAA